MTIALEFGEHGLAHLAADRLARHLEEVRVRVIDLLAMDDALRARRIVFRTAAGAEEVGRHAAGGLALPEIAGVAGEAPSFSSHDGDLCICVPPALRTPPMIERLMVGQLLHVGMRVPASVCLRFILDGVLGVLDSAAAPKAGRVNMPLLSFLATRGTDGEPLPLQPLLGGRCDPADLREYLAVSAAFVGFVLSQYGPARLAMFARNLKPEAPDEASRAAFHKPFQAITLEWRAWAHGTQGRRLSVAGFVAKGLTLYAGQRRQSAVVAAAMLPQLGYTLLMPVGLSVLFNSGILKGNASVITHTLTWLSIGYVVAAIGGLAQDYCSSIAAARAIAALRERMFRHVQQLPDVVLENAESGKLTSTFSSDMMLIETVVTRVLPNLTFRSVLLVGSVIIAFFMEWRMALASVICLPVAFLAPRPLSQLATRASYERKSEDATLAGLVQENVVQSRTIRMFQLQQNRLAAFLGVLTALDKKTERANVFSALAGRLTTVGASFVQLLVIGMGAVLSLDGTVSAGTVIAFIGLLLNMGGAIAVLGDALPLLIQAVGAWQRVDMLMDAPVSAEAQSAVPADSWDGVRETVTFDDVVFNYPGSDPVLDRVSFEVRMGQAVAFVGASGSGKSTILNLIQRHLDITGGALLLDGTPIGAINGTDLRRHMATVAQDTPLFAMSVKDNIRMGRLDATDAEIIAAAEAADIDADIRRMPQGYDTMVGASGGQVSGGQKQRIAIARALLRNPTVLILDEATSALDPASEKTVDATLARLRDGRMILAATHRLQQAVDMDLIVVLDRGRIVETGTHAQLLARGGFYAKLWSEQSGLDLSEDGRSAAITLERLRAVPFFAHLPDDILGAIGRALHSESFAADQVLLRAGAEPDRLFILVRGSVAMSAIGADGTASRTRMLQPGACFGEAALLAGLHQVETATAASACCCLTLQRAQFIAAFGSEAALRAQTESAISEGLAPKLDGLVRGPGARAKQTEPA